MPLVSQTFDQLIDFTRTTAGTFVGSNGLIQNTPASRNLFTFTQQFDNAAWVKTAAQVVPNQNPAAATLGSELRGSITTALLGTAPAATYNTSTGAGTAERLVGANFSYLVIPNVVINRVYAIDITNTGSNPITIRAAAPTGSAVGTIAAGATVTSYVVAATAQIFVAPTADNQAIAFTINSVREVVGGFNTAPDGTLTADTLLATAGTHCPQANQVVATVNATAYTASWFVRAGTATFVQLAINGQTADWCNFTLTGNGSVQNNGAAVGAISFNSATGYYRISMAYTAGGTDRRPIFAIVPSGTATRLQTATYVGTESVIIWGAQLELGSLTDYTRNAGGVFPPRFDFDPVTLAPRGLLIEEQRTNLLLRSEEIGVSPWSLQRATIAANVATAPDGTSTADRLVDNAENGTHRVFQSSAKAASAVTYTGSIFIKADTLGFATVRLSGQGETSFTSVGINLSTGELSALSTSGFTGASAQAQSFGNGWWRVSITGTSDTTELIFLLVGTANSLSASSSYVGTGDGIFLWGAQIEAGAFATSYIPTVASQVTRTADQASITGANFSQWYNQSEGTFVAEFASFVGAAVNSPRVLAASDGTVNNRIRAFLGNTNTTVQVTNGSVLQATLNNTPATTYGVINKLAFAVKANDFASSINGGAVATATGGSMPAAINRLDIGADASGLALSQLNGHIRRITYYPVRLSNAQLQALTA